jgi:hypothetical protein
MEGIEIETLISESASTAGRTPLLILPPMRPNMALIAATERRVRTINFESNHLCFSGGVIPYITPPEATIPQNEAQNVPPDDGTMAGITVQVSLIIFSIIIVFLYVGTAVPVRFSNQWDRTQWSFIK